MKSQHKHYMFSSKEEVSHCLFNFLFVCLFAHRNICYLVLRPIWLDVTMASDQSWGWSSPDYLIWGLYICSWWRRQCYLKKKNKNNNNFFATLCIFCFICLSKDFGICFRITLHVKSRKIFYAYSAHLFFHLFIQRFRILLPDNPSRQIKENIVCLFCVSLLFLLSIQRFQICFRITLYVKSRRISYGLYI